MREPCKSLSVARTFMSTAWRASEGAWRWTAGSRESLSRPAPLTSEGDSHLPLGRRGRVIQMRQSRNLNYFFFEPSASKARRRVQQLSSKRLFSWVVSASQNNSGKSLRFSQTAEQLEPAQVQHKSCFRFAEQLCAELSPSCFRCFSSSFTPRNS